MEFISWETVGMLSAQRVRKEPAAEAYDRYLSVVLTTNVPERSGESKAVIE